MVLGREAAGAAVFRGDRAVSRRHAVLRVVDGNCVVEDQNSTNGTFINDTPVDRPTVLGPEDELRIGSTRLRLVPALAGTDLLDAVPAEAEDGLWDGTADGDPTVPVSGAKAADRGRARKAGKLTLGILAAIAGTVLASALNGSPQLRLAAAVLGSAVPAFITEPGRHQRARVTAAVVVMAGALFVTYGGATLFTFATERAAIFPVPPVIQRPTHRATPASTHRATPARTGTGTVTPPPTSPPPTGTATAPPLPTPSTSPPTAPPPPPSNSPPTSPPAPPPTFTETPAPPIG